MTKKNPEAKEYSNKKKTHIRQVKRRYFLFDRSTVTIILNHSALRRETSIDNRNSFPTEAKDL